MYVMNIILKYFFIFTLVVSTGATSQPSKQCVNLYDSLLEVSLIDSIDIASRDFSALTPQVRPKNSKGLDVRKIFPNEKRVILGIEKRKHVVMFVGDSRYDGRILRYPATTKYKKNEELPAGEGIYVEFTNLSDNAFLTLTRVISEQPESAYFGCANAICSVLNKAGVQTNIPEEFVVKTSRFMELILTGKFVEQGKPLDYSIYSTSQINFLRWSQNLTRYDNKALREIGEKFRGWSPERIVESLNDTPTKINQDVRNFILMTTNSSEQQRKPSLEMITGSLKSLDKTD